MKQQFSAIVNMDRKSYAKQCSSASGGGAFNQLEPYFMCCYISGASGLWMFAPNKTSLLLLLLLLLYATCALISCLQSDGIFSNDAIRIHA